MMSFLDKVKDLAGRAQKKVKDLEESGQLDDVRDKAEGAATKAADLIEDKTGKALPDAVRKGIDKIGSADDDASDDAADTEA